MVDLNGKKSDLTERWASALGAAWSPSGDEIWFTATATGFSRSLQGVSLSGKVRVLLGAPGTLTLHDVGAGGRALISRDAMRADSLAWDDIAKFRDIWPGVLMLKGVNRSDDAIKALSYGVDGIVVSNHGGRNMDSAAATLDVLPEIAEAVGDRMTLILDSGVRRGSDIVKALALGAKAVLTGRATLYGTAAGGEAGALKAINILKNEADKTMAYTGCRTVDEVSSDIFWGYREGNRLVGAA